jgi:perosamine synthetase
MLPWLGDEEYRAIAPCFETNWVTEGPKSREFHDRLLDLIGCRYAVFAPNGTLAIYLALRGLGIGPGDEVLVPDFTFIASANAVEMTGATPVFVQVNRDNFQIDVARAERWITPKTRAVMPVHIYGAVAEMNAVIAFSEQHNLAIVEDAAQAIDVRYDGQHAGTLGAVGTFSFFADKTITTGEGGLVVTNDEAIYDQLLYLRNQGRKNRGTFIHPEIGYNFRITDIQAAIGLVQLGKLPRIRERKLEILALYRERLEGLETFVRFFQPPGRSEFIPFRVPLICERANELMTFLEKHEIEPRTFFYPLHRQPCFAAFIAAQLGAEDEASVFENAIYGYEHGVCLPVFPTLTDEQVEYVCATIRVFYESR